MNVNSDGIILTTVVDNTSVTNVKIEIERWEFQASNIKAVSASKRDDRAMFVYIYENADDFTLTFPSAKHCTRLTSLIIFALH